MLHPPADIPEFLQSGETCRLYFSSQGTDEKRAQLQGLALPVFYGIPEGSLSPEQPLGPGALPTGRFH